MNVAVQIRSIYKTNEDLVGKEAGGGGETQNVKRKMGGIFKRDSFQQAQAEKFFDFF